MRSRDVCIFFYSSMVYLSLYINIYRWWRQCALLSPFAMKSRCHCYMLLLLLSNEWNWCMNGNKCSENSSRFRYVSHRYALVQRGANSRTLHPQVPASLHEGHCRDRQNIETVFNKLAAAFSVRVTPRSFKKWSIIDGKNACTQAATQKHAFPAPVFTTQVQHQ